MDPSLNHFPSTHRTWLVTHIEELQSDGDATRHEALLALRAHLFERYAAPLATYANHSSMRRLGDANELVHGYLVRTLEDCSSFARWPQSGRLLRRWLLAGLLFYARGIARDAGRSREHAATTALDLHLGSEPTAEEAFERACAREILEAAFVRAHASMTAAGRDQSWEIFRRHLLDGEAYASISRELNLSTQNCADATRVATQEVRKALRSVLLDEGVPEREVTVEADSIFKSVVDAATR